MFKSIIKLCIFLICLHYCSPMSVPVTREGESMCGMKKIVRTPKIINGKDAYHGQYPWAVSLRLHRRHHCGGALIDHNWVLTAAHCVAQISHRVFTVKLGAHYRNTEPEASSIEIPVKQVVPHESFSFSSFANDIALVRLAKSVEFNNYIWPVCLPPTDNVDYTNSTGTVIGWGKITPSGTSATTLQQVDLPIIDNNKCIKWYESQGKVIPIRPTQFCAGMEEGGKDACQGDSGSPMMKVDQSSGQAQAIGIVSAGIGCALPKLPGLYTRVASYLPWINQNVNSGTTPDKMATAHPFPEITMIHVTPTQAHPTYAPLPGFPTHGPVHALPTHGSANHHPTQMPVHVIHPSNNSVIIIHLPKITPKPIVNASTTTTTLSPNTTTTKTELFFN